MRRTITVCMAGAAIAALSTPLRAQTAPAGERTERADEDAFEADIIVTAQRRRERLQDVPVAVNVFNADRLEASGITDILDAVAFTPSVETFPSQGGGGTIQIRGVSTGIGGPGVDPNVAIYWDGIYVARSIVAYQDFIDVERVEILRGPQGTLYGRNATGGAINVIRKTPGPDYGAELRFDIGDFNRIGAAAAVNIPAGEAFAVRGFVSRQMEDNYAINLVNNDRLKRVDSIAGGITAAFRPSDRFTAILRADIEQDDGLGVVAQSVDRTGTDNANAILPDDPFEFRNDFLQNDNLLKHHGIGGELTWETTDGHVLKSLTGYRRIRTNLLWDQDATEIPAAFFRQADTSRAFSQEFQIASPTGGRFDWIAGLYYFRENATIITSNGGPINYALFTGLYDPATNTNIMASVPFSNRGFYDVENRTRAWAGYGELRYDIVPAVRATIGLRYSEERKRFNGRVRRVFSPTLGDIDDTPFDVAGTCAALVAQGALSVYSATDPAGYCASPNPSGGAFTNLQTLVDYYSVFDSALDRPEQRLSESKLTPRFILEYRPAPGILTYVSATRGYKSGGFNTYDTNPIITDANGDGVVDRNDAGLIPFQDPFGGESLWSYELGAKTTLLDNRLTLNLNYFRYDYSNIQIQVFNNADRTNFVTNGATARIQGIELDGALRPWAGGVIDFAGAWIDGEYTSVDFPISDQVTGDELDPTGLSISGQPRWKWNVGAQHTLAVNAAGIAGLTLRGEWAHRGRSRYGLTIADTTIGGDYDLLNLRATLTDTSGHLSLSAYVQNLTNEVYSYYIGDSELFGRSRLLGPPRTFGMTLSARW